MFSFAVGAVACGLLISVFGVGGAAVAAGLFVPAILGLAWLSLRALDRDARAPDPEALALLRNLPIFAPLGAPSMERILAELSWQEHPAGHVLIREGDPGDQFYVIADGRVRVTQNGRFIAERGQGDPIGEIALLRSVPRTATVTALTALRVIAIERDRFLEAVTGHPESLREAEAVATKRLQDDAGS
jgi:signal-transduction protein with cAMP-binding, CBS, and nucleotidyltransferase domain